MSGFEMAGLALAILPLLISTAEHYDDCFRPFLRYKRFSKEAKEFRQLLETQKTIFRGQCSFLLEHILEQRDVATGMLNASSHPLWSDPELEARIVQALGEQKNTCISLVELIKEQLQEIEAESQKIAELIDLEKVTFSMGRLHTHLGIQAKDLFSPLE